MNNSNYITPEEIDIAVEGLFSKIKDGTKEISDFISSEKKRTKEIKAEDKRKYQLDLAKRYPNGLGKKYQHLIDEENKKNEEEERMKKEKESLPSSKTVSTVISHLKHAGQKIISNLITSAIVKGATLPIHKRMFKRSIKVYNSDIDKSKIKVYIKLLYIDFLFDDDKYPLKNRDQNAYNKTVDNIISSLEKGKSAFSNIFKTNNIDFDYTKYYYNEYEDSEHGSTDHGDDTDPSNFDYIIELELEYTIDQFNKLMEEMD